MKWGISILVLGVLASVVFGFTIKGKMVFSEVSAVLVESFRSFKGERREHLAAEITIENGNSVANDGVVLKEPAGTKSGFDRLTTGSENTGLTLKKESDVLALSSSSFGTNDPKGNGFFASTTGDASALFNSKETRAVAERRQCEFSVAGTPSHEVIFNEIAWMGTGASASDEWIEIAEMGGENISIAGWHLMTESGKINAAIESGNVAAQFFLLERTNDATVPEVFADLIYTGSLSNTGEYLRLFDQDCRLIDDVDARAGWPAGDNAAKRTMERRNDLTWQTSMDIGGTPHRVNSSGILSEKLKTGDEISPQRGTIPSSTAANTSPSFIISEVFYDAEGSDSGKEFIELLNGGNTGLDLTGWKIIYNGNPIATVGGKADDTVTILPGDYFLVGFSGYNGTPPADIVRSASLPNGAGAVLLLDSTGVRVHEVSYDGSALSGQSVGRVGDSTILQPTAPSPRE